MTALAQYVLRITGELEGNKDSNKDAIQQLESIFRKPDGNSGAKIRDDESWPRGVWLEGYDLCQWRACAETGLRYPDITILDFRTEINSVKEGQLYDNRKTMLPDVEWFYSSVDKRWHKELLGLLNNFNNDKKGKLISRLWFREWRWYCGNGGP